MIRRLLAGSALALAALTAAPAMAAQYPALATDTAGNQAHVAPVAIVAYSVSTGFATQSVSGSAVALSPPTGSTVCFIQTEGAAVRYRTDGTSPTASSGVPLAVGVTLKLTLSNLATAQFIAQSGAATLDEDCYK